MRTPILSLKAPATRRVIASSLAVIAVYLITGWFGLLLTPLSGYASAIFPPAGIAVTVVFVAGGRLLAPVCIAAALLELWFAASIGHGLNDASILAALLIAAAATLQAAAGGYALRRVVGYPTNMDHGHAILRFIGLAPLICMVSATLSIASLLALGGIARQDAAWSWITWWAGDTIGLLIMFPLVMVAIARPRPLWRSRVRTVALPMLIFSALFITIFVKAENWGYASSLAEFHLLSQEASDRIQARFDEQSSLLEQMAGLFSGDARITPADFRRFVHRSLLRYPIVKALEWAPRVSRKQRAAFEALQQAALPGFRITERGTHGHLRRAAARPYYYPVTYLQPLAGNRAAAGYDLASNPARLHAIGETLHSDRVITTAPLRLVQEKGNQESILLLLAAGGPCNGPGVVLSVLRMGDFIKETARFAAAQFHLRLIDTATGIPLYDDFPVRPIKPVFTATLRFGDRRYRLETVPTTGYLVRHREWESWSVLASGLLFTSLLGALLLLGSGYTARVEALVGKRTRELRHSEARLSEAQRIAHLGSWEINLKDGHIVWSHETYLIFETLPDRADTRGDAFLRSVHPDDRAAVKRAHERAQEDRIPYDIEYRLLFADGRTKFVQEQGRVYHDAGGRPLRLVGTVQDITERKLAERSLRESEERFRSALEYAPIGMALVASDGRLLQVNNALCELLAYDTPSLQETPLQDHVHPADLALLTTAIERLLHSPSPSQQVELRCVRRDGEPLWVQTTLSLMRDGNDAPAYFIVQFEDISERRRAQEQIHQLAYYDPLTGLPNRRLLLERLERALLQAKRYQRVMAVMFVDLDEFKRINDTLGHPVGDALLKVAAERMADAVRGIDIVARQGGDEFIVVLTEISDDKAAALVADKIIAAFHTPIEAGGNRLHISASIGIAILPAEGTDDAQELMKKADIAMYRAKAGGRNTYRIY